MLKIARAYQGKYFFLGSMTISWTSSKQKIVALSSYEVGYIAGYDAACQGIGLSHLIVELRGSEINLLKTKVDNQSTITPSENPVHHSRTKYTDTRYHFARSSNQTADVFTKALGRIKLELFRTLMSLRCIEDVELDPRD